MGSVAAGCKPSVFAAFNKILRGRLAPFRYWLCDALCRKNHDAERRASKFANPSFQVGRRSRANRRMELRRRDRCSGARKPGKSRPEPWHRCWPCAGANSPHLRSRFGVQPTQRAAWQQNRCAQRYVAIVCFGSFLLSTVLLTQDTEQPKVGMDQRIQTNMACKALLGCFLAPELNVATRDSFPKQPSRIMITFRKRFKID